MSFNVPISVTQVPLRGPRGDVTPEAEEARDQAQSYAELSGPFLFFPTRVAADAALAGLPEGQQVQVWQDESQAGHRVAYTKTDGAYVKVADFSYPALDLADISDPDKGAAMVGFNGGTVRDALMAQPVQALRAKAQSLCIDACERAASGTLAHKYIVPGPGYDVGQWVWDSSWTAIAAASMGQAARAQEWLLNWPDRQLANGMLPCTISPNQAIDNTAYSQVPVLARAVHTLYTYTNDYAFLEAMYPCLKAFHGWWETYRMDGGGLFSYGSSRPGVGVGQAGQDARYESGMDENIGYVNGSFAAISGTTVDHCLPDLCGWLADAADHIALIAGILGEAADQVAYDAKADAIRAQMNALMWDDEQGCYLPVCRADFALGLGTIGAAAAAGATSITLTAATARDLAKGAKLILGGVTAQVGVDTLAGATVIPTLVPLAAPVAAGVQVQMRSLLYFKTLPGLMTALFCGAASQAQARRIVEEHLTASLDGMTVETATLYLGSGYNLAASNSASYLFKYRHLSWSPPGDAGGAAVNASDWTIANQGSPVATIYGRGKNDDVHSAISTYRADWESITPTRPLTISTTYKKSSAGGRAQVLFSDYPANTGPYNTVVDVGGADGDIVTSVATVAIGPYLPYDVQIRREGNGGDTDAVPFKRIALASEPQGFVWMSPFGLLANARLSQNTVAMETNAQTNETADYWHGDHWVNLEYMSVLGLIRYGMTGEAYEITRRVVARCASELARTGQIWERYGMRGQGKGSPNYAWSALVVPMAAAVGLG